MQLTMRLGTLVLQQLDEEVRGYLKTKRVSSVDLLLYDVSSWSTTFYNRHLNATCIGPTVKILYDISQQRQYPGNVPPLTLSLIWFVLNLKKLRNEC